ncbi:hypothetical protein EIK77_004675 [Talaromyces pinophilus]|nr:hypothetical protein EIK77_004675 [Talaromyces pinophilus]
MLEALCDYLLEKPDLYLDEMKDLLWDIFHVSVMANLALTYSEQGRWNEAEKLEVQVMGTSKTVLGAEHSDTLISMANLAYTWKSQGKLQDALTLIKNCSHLCSKVLGPDHPDSKSASRTINDWMDEYNTLPNQPLLTGNSCLQPLSVSPAVLAAQVTLRAHINSPYAQKRSVTKPFLGNHPLIIAARTTSPGAEIQDTQDVD